MRKEVTTTKGLISQAQAVYFSQFKKLQKLEAEAEEVRAELNKLGEFLKSLGLDLDDVVKKKKAQSARMSKARKARKPKAE